MFEVAAEAYDNFMGVYSAQLAPQLAELADVGPGQRVLDVGCGTGVLTAELVGRLGPTGVAAVDPSDSFVAAVRQRHPEVEVKHATAEELPFPDASFDAALAQLVVHFMADPVGGVREMARVTRPGGVIAACVWDFESERSPIAGFWQAAKELDPEAQDESEPAGGRRGHLGELFRTAGLDEVSETELVATRTFPTFDDWWETFTRGVSPSGTYAQSLDDERRAALRERCSQLLGEAPFTIHAVAWAARGVT